jgi:hypothetical protein
MLLAKFDVIHARKYVYFSGKIGAGVTQSVEFLATD